jgi:hypothetical protein
MTYPLVLDLAADGVPGDLPGAWVLHPSVVKWRKAFLAQRLWDDAQLINAALAIPLFAKKAWTEQEVRTAGPRRPRRPSVRCLGRSTRSG